MKKLQAPRAFSPCRPALPLRPWFLRLIDGGGDKVARFDVEMYTEKP